MLVGRSERKGFYVCEYACVWERERERERSQTQYRWDLDGGSEDYRAFEWRKPREKASELGSV